MKKIIAVLALLLVPSFAHAVLVNGNFEVGLAGWTIAGDVLTVDSSFGVDPPQGHLQVLLTTAPCQIFCFGSEHPESYSGTNAIEGTFSLLLFFDLPSAPTFFFEWSGIKQTFVANTDILLSFTWKFLWDLGPDLPFYVIDGVANFLTSSGGSVSPTPFVSVSPTPFVFETPYETTSFFLPAGTHTIGFGVGDIFDIGSNSGVLVDDISFRAVPEPATWLLFGVGLILLAAVIKFRRSHR